MVLYREQLKMGPCLNSACIMQPFLNGTWGGNLSCCLGKADYGEGWRLPGWGEGRLVEEPPSSKLRAMAVITASRKRSMKVLVRRLLRTFVSFLKIFLLYFSILHFTRDVTYSKQTLSAVFHYIKVT